MITTHLDHIVVGASTLEEGADYVEKILGVRVPDGGEHIMMGTHNKVMTLGNGVYLEIIAVNFEMTPPAQPRWFGLDDPNVLASLVHSPRLLTWAVNTSDLTQLTLQSKISVGEIKQAERGDLRWKVALPDDGRLSAAGFFPLCIEWQVDFHPSERMPNLDCRLEGIEIHHPRSEWLKHCLTSVSAENLVRIQKCNDNQSAFMQAKVLTPSGTRILSSEIH